MVNIFFDLFLPWGLIMLTGAMLMVDAIRIDQLTSELNACKLAANARNMSATMPMVTIQKVKEYGPKEGDTICHQVPCNGAIHCTWRSDEDEMWRKTCHQTMQMCELCNVQQNVK